MTDTTQQAQTPNALLITTDGAVPIYHALTLEAIQETVGGYIDVGFTVDGPDGHALTSYVHDEGLLIGLPLTTVTDTGAYLVGPCLIVGLDGGGETVPLTSADLDWLEERTGIIYALKSDDRRAVDAVTHLALTE